MSDIIIKVENLSKRYRLGELHKQNGSFREKIIGSFRKLIEPMSHSQKSKRYAPRSIQPSKNGYIWALRDVTFEINRGETVGIIGRNGSGKSTLLKILSRITKPTEGKAYINGKVGSLLEVGTGFHPELTGRENIFLNGAILGMTKIEIKRKLDEIITFSEIEKFIDTPVKRYSSGMYVRLAFSVAAHLVSEILLIDEVLAVGDTAFQKKCLGKINHAADKGRTVIFVSHNIPIITNLCKKSILLEDGSVSEFGVSLYVTSKYLESMNADYQHKGEKTSHLSGSLSLKQLFFSVPNKGLSSVIGSGESVEITWVITAFRTFNNITLSIGIYDELDRLLCTIDSGNANRSFQLNVGKNMIKCHIEKLPLNSGIYKINAAIKVNNNLLSGYKDVCFINVYNNYFNESSDIKNRGYILISHSWSEENFIYG